MMNKLQRISLGAILLTLISVPMVHAESVTLTDSHIQTIKANCASAQSSMRQLQLTEAGTRNNRGRSYESISKLMTALNSRVVLNKLSIPPLTVSTTEMEKRFMTFKKDYDDYYDSLAATIKLPCTSQPVTFYDSLVNTRALRAKVAQDIKLINETLDAYQNGINTDLRTNVLSARTTQ